MPSSAWTAAACKSLGLTTSDLAEIGGVTDRQAQRWMKGHPLPEDMIQSLSDIANDVEVVCERIIARIEAGGNQIVCYRNNEDIRADNAMPARGRAAGGFAGAFLVAAFNALENADEAAELVFSDDDD